MLIFKWDAHLETGVELIDQQHKQIIESANAFFISYRCQHGYDKIAGCLSFLEQYVLYHFQAEEAFQVKCNYPEYRSHQATHKMLQTQVKFHITNLTCSRFSQESVDNFYGFLREWIIQHILTDDFNFAEYYRSLLPPAAASSV